MYPMLSAAESDAFTSWFFVLCLFGGLAVAIVWIIFPFFVLRDLGQVRDQSEKLRVETAAMREALDAINNNLVAYGQSMEARLDRIAAGQQKTPGHSSSGVRYEIGEE